MVQEISTKSWGSRIMGALAGVIVGFIFIIGAFILIFWNEGNRLHTVQSLEQASKVVISVPSSPIDNKNNMQLVYLSGLATTDDVLHDDLFNVSEKAIQLDRHVEMYQWEENVSTETKKQLGGSEQEVKTYSYNQTWSPKLIDSSEFKEQNDHKNPASMPIKAKLQYAKAVTVGDFNLPADMIKEIGGSTTVDLSHADLEKIKAKINKPIQIDGENIYAGTDVNTPAIGDMRITITTVLPQIVSIIAQQTGNTLQPYMAKSGVTVSLIEVGQSSPESMIHNASVSNNIITWILRFVSLVVMIIGFALIMKPISVLADVVPLFGSIIAAGTGFIAFIVGFCLWAIAIAIAWFVVRPVWAVGMLIMVGLICYLLYRRRQNKLAR